MYELENRVTRQPEIFDKCEEAVRGEVEKHVEGVDERECEYVCL